MDLFEPIKKNSGFFIIPFFWLAYFIDFNISHVHDTLLESASSFAPWFVYSAKTFVSIFYVVLALFFVYGALLFASHKFESNMPILALAISFSCFGVVGLFKGMEILPFQSLNLFWHLGSLSAGLWLFEQIEEQNKANV